MPVVWDKPARVKDRLAEALSLQDKRQYGAAAAAFTAILESEPENPTALHYLGVVNWQRGLAREQCDPHALKALSLKPLDPIFNHNYGSMLSTYGDLAKAEAHFRQAIASAPNYIEAYYNLINVMKVKADEPVLPKLRDFYAAGTISKLQREYLCFALAKAYDDLGEPETAIRFCLEANYLAARTYDIAAAIGQLKEMEALMTRKSLAPRPGRGDPSEQPVFIVGMPRSGTTLVETILARHPQINPGGELRLMDDIEAAGLEKARLVPGFTGGAQAMVGLMSDADVKAHGANAISLVKMYASRQHYSRYTDKLPRNALRLGLISAVFPRARIIHVRRHALDCCVSNLFQRFQGEQHAYNMITLGKYYRVTAGAMEHWKKVVPLPILDMRYEDVVADLEGSAKRMVDFIGLPWDPACLDPAKAVRTIKTSSLWQVRQPIYSQSAGRWRRYEKWLGPLIQVLGGMDWIENDALASRKTNH